jgi:hypothetical protein
LPFQLAQYIDYDLDELTVGVDILEAKVNVDLINEHRWEKLHSKRVKMKTTLKTSEDETTLKMSKNLCLLETVLLRISLKSTVIPST